MSVILSVARPVASETALEKTKDGFADSTDCNRRYGGSMDASSRTLLFLLSDKLVPLSDGMGMVCGVSEQEEEY